MSQHASDQVLISEAVPGNGPQTADPMVSIAQAMGFLQGAVHA